MKRRGCWTKLWLHSIMGLTLMVAVACNSGPASKNAEGKTAAASDKDSSHADNDSSHVDVMCIGDRLNNPPEAFHYSYKHSNETGWEQAEADITPQAMDITLKNKTGAHSYHGVRSDEQSWGSAVLDLSGLNITAMSARLDALNNTSAISGQGSEAINGYKATKIAIDTASANSADRQQYATLFGKSSFEKGTIWMAEDGCLANLVLDEGLEIDGALKKAHYEMARSRKQ